MLGRLRSGMVRKKRVYYGLVTIGNDGSNGERVRVMLDGVLRSEEKCE